MQAHSRKDFVTFVLILGSLTALGPLSIDMYLPAFSDMARDMSASPAQIQLSLSLFLAGLSIGQLFYGSVSDRYGRKKPLYAGLAIFIAATLACTMVKDADHLIALRFCQAMGMCAGMVISRAMVRDLFDTAKAAQVFSLLILVMGLAPILAPLIGGYVTEAFGWRVIFWILLFFGCASLATVIFKLPETRAFDPSIRLSRTFSTYMTILRDRRFLMYALPGCIAFGGFFGYVTGAPFVFIGIYGIEPDHFGWIFGVNAIGFIAVSQINARLVRRFAPQTVLKYGLLSAAFFGAFLITFAVLGFGMWSVWPCLFFYIASIGLIGPNAMSCAMASQSVSHAGSASALSGTLQFICSAIASATLSLTHPHSVIPMAVIVGICGLLAMTSFHMLTRKTPA